jgi:hypothetical protein
MPVLIALLAAAMAVSGCATSTPAVVESLDPLTGATLTRGTAPLVLYSGNSAAAAHARDYLYLGPLLVNRMGQHDYYLWLGIWSTLQEHDPATQRDGFESVVVYADGEPFELELAGWTTDSIGISQPAYVKPVASAADAFYRVTRDQIRLLSQADDIRIRTSSTRSRTYEPWGGKQSGKAALAAFLDHLY